MFAVAGMQLYTTTRFGLRLGPTANYESYTKAIFLIWQLITGDDMTQQNSFLNNKIVV